MVLNCCSLQLFICYGRIEEGEKFQMLLFLKKRYNSFFFLTLFILGCAESSLLHAGFLLIAASRAALVAVLGLLIAVAFLVAEHGL